MALLSLLRARTNRLAFPGTSTPRRRSRPCVELLEDRLAPATFLVTNTNDAGQGSLRQAILSANAAAGADTINFNIPSLNGGPAAIVPASALPTLTGPVTIAGDTQPGFRPGVPLVELNGARAGVGANGLVLKAAGCVVRGLIIDQFGGNGILALGANGDVEGCFIGTNAAGTAKAGNGYHGVLIAGTATGVHIGGGIVTARNVISGNGLDGVAILGSATAGNHVSGNYIGTNAAGTAALPNGLDGVQVAGGSKNNVIGGTVVGTTNVISGNTGDGVAISDTGTTGNQVQGNLIGTNAAGTAAVGNTGNGVLIEGGATNLVGGTVADARNVISGNSVNGVTIDHGTGNQVQGNLIGTNTAGTNALANLGDGVGIFSGSKNMVGGTAAGAGNVISGNGGDSVAISAGMGNQVQGNFIGTNAAGTAAVKNGGAGVFISASNNNMVGGTAAGARNVISGNGNSGVNIDGTAGNQVQGNFIGTNAAGTAALPNAAAGVFINFGVNNMVGGTAAGTRNVISGNGGDGVIIFGGDGNKVQGNFIGTNAAGTGALPNAAAGVGINDSVNNMVGGTVVAARNVISGNGGAGVEISQAGAAGNQVQGNYIGTNAAGTAALPNSGDGVRLITVGNNTVGGTTVAARNIISGNGNSGVNIDGAAGNQVQGNYIGTNAAGTAALPNAAAGVLIQGGAASNTVGGTTTTPGTGAGNVVSGNGADGVVISDAGTTGNQVQGNLIGLAANGTAILGNTSHGVFITNGAANNSIGGTAAGAGNRIAHNGGDGVLIGSDPQRNFINPASSGNSVEGNSIFANAGAGIDLGPDDGPTPNDTGDTDTGPNNLLNTPVLTSAFLSGTSLFLTGFVNTQLNLTLRIEFFANPAGGGQGQTFLGILNVNTFGGNNTVVFTTTLTVPAFVLAGQTLTATATDDLGNTSEFSLPLTIE